MAVEPQAISVGQLRARLAGLGALLTAQATYSGLSEGQLAAQYVLDAQNALVDDTRVAFFSTRYCTREIASQDTLTFGTDVDRWVDPRDYRMLDWKTGTGRTKTQYGPLTGGSTAALTTLRLTLTQAGKVVDVPLAWCNAREWTGKIDVMPFGASAVSYTAYYSLVGVLSIQRQAYSRGVVPSLCHLRYTAGLCARTYTSGLETKNFDPDSDAAVAACCQYDVGLVRRYQAAIASKAAAKLCVDVAREMDLGGFSVAFDGLSQSVNPEVLYKQAEQFEARVAADAEDLKNRRGSFLLGSI